MLHFTLYSSLVTLQKGMYRSMIYMQWLNCGLSTCHYVSLLVDVKILLLKMLSGTSYVLALDNVMFGVQVYAGIKLLANRGGAWFQNIKTVYVLSKTRWEVVVKVGFLKCIVWNWGTHSFFRIHGFWDMTLCHLVSGSWCSKRTQCYTSLLTYHLSRQPWTGNTIILLGRLDPWRSRQCICLRF
jgi:hypothetical protein